MGATRLGLTADVLSVDSLTRTVLDTADGPVGAVATFVGLVRGENLGRKVGFLEYEAYEALALKAFARID
jgi:molybdopterin synthase catalytic subunit